MSRLYLLLNAPIKNLRLIIIGMDGLDRLAPRGQFIYHRNIEVAIQSHSQCTRNRSCRHYQHMRRHLAFLPQTGSLCHTETMLLVDDGKPQTLELHIILYDSVGSHQDIHRTVFQSVQDSLSPLPLYRSRK